MQDMPGTADLAAAFAADGVACVRAALDPAEVAVEARGTGAVLASPGPLTQGASGADDPGAFTEDFRRWREIPETDRLALHSQVPRIAAALMATPPETRDLATDRRPRGPQAWKPTPAHHSAEQPDMARATA